MDDIRLSYNHAQDAESYKAWVEENFAPVLHWEFGKHPSFPTVIRPTLFMTLNVTGRRDEVIKKLNRAMDINGDKVTLTWPDCPPLCRLCSSEGHDSRTCLLKERKRPQAPKTFVFDSISTTTAQQKNPPTNNGSPLVFGASSTEKSQTDADGFTLVTRRKGKRSKAGKKDQTQPEQENPSTSAMNTIKTNKTYPKRANSKKRSRPNMNT
ncbi:uncharacterized protein VTP21DRAFT_9669 [Calcarisporiella thermophila]|uniref:uncharacterized protein n=1 Tax=Calcarisporiella thermophila TaxID=911321 RepID=UPI00374461C0